jgi:hypothetical protein
MVHDFVIIEAVSAAIGNIGICGANHLFSGRLCAVVRLDWDNYKILAMIFYLGLAENQ